MSSSPVFSVQAHIISAQHIREYPGATLHNQEDDLKLHIKQYIPRDQAEIPSGAMTIIGAHANGFLKVCVHQMVLWYGLLSLNQYRSSMSLYGRICIDA